LRITGNIRINLILPESIVIGLHLRHDSVGLSPFKFSWWAPKDARVLKQLLKIWLFKVIQGRWFSKLQLLLWNVERCGQHYYIVRNVASLIFVVNVGKPETESPIKLTAAASLGFLAIARLSLAYLPI